MSNTHAKSEHSGYLSFEEVREHATGLGFDDVAVTYPGEWDSARWFADLQEYIASGNHGTMKWLARDAQRRANPINFWSSVRSALLLGVNYNHYSGDLMARARNTLNGVVSIYAAGDDYHRVMQKRLRRLARWLAGNFGGEARCFVDTSAIMEKPLAEAASLGWQGKHTNLVSRNFGSWLFLGVILADFELPRLADAAALKRGSCGTCRACIRACPTDALSVPYRLNVPRCIAYLTIEHEGMIERELRELMGTRIYGCDDCLAVCPWNRFARASREMRFAPRAAADSPPLRWALRLSDYGFMAAFAGSAIKRIGIIRWHRNALIAAGNSRGASLVPDIVRHLRSPHDVVRATALWAARRHMSAPALTRLYRRYCPAERSRLVLNEWQVARR